jgi:hypothetical protein
MKVWAFLNKTKTQLCLSSIAHLVERQLSIRARICNRLWSPGIGFEESIPPGWESRPGLLNLKDIKIRAHTVFKTRFYGA